MHLERELPRLVKSVRSEAGDYFCEPVKPRHKLLASRIRQNSFQISELECILSESLSAMPITEALEEGEPRLTQCKARTSSLTIAAAQVMICPRDFNGLHTMSLLMDLTVSIPTPLMSHLLRQSLKA